MEKSKYSRIRMDSGQHRRIMAVAITLGVLAFVPVVLRLYDLMIVKFSYYRDLALENQTRVTAVTGDRGQIFDRNMNVLAGSRNVANVYLNPRELRQAKVDLPAMAENLGRMLEKDPEWILSQAKDRTQRYRQIGFKVDQQTADEIRIYMNENRIAGIHLEPNNTRNYPFGTLASQVIGFTNDSGTGSEGVEASYNAYLEGKASQVITTKGNNEMDMPFSYENYRASRPGCSVVLTLDATVQQMLEKQLETAMDRYDVQNGAFGMVMNVNTGEVLAMATLGGYDPNAYLELADETEQKRLDELQARYEALPESSAEYRQGEQYYREEKQKALLKQWRNRCISDGYEPGSTFKVLTMAAALDSGAIDLNTDFYCRGSEQIPGRAQKLHCWKHAGHGPEKTPQAIQNSCNIAFAHIALKLGGERFYQYVKQFGILEKTGIDLYGESKGVFFDKSLVTDTDKWGTASLTSGSFGQTFKLTPMQLVRAISSVVNGGKLMEPYLVSEVLDEQGNPVLQQEPTVIRQTIRPETSETMCRLLESVVTEGTAKNAHVAGYRIGGKTGTSEKIDVFDEKGQRVLDKIVSFVGVAPIDNPEYIVLVALDTPSRQTGIYISGGVMAAPTVGAVMGDMLPYLGVKPSFSQEEPAGRIYVMQDYVGLTRKEAESILKGQTVTAEILGQGETITGQIPGPGQSIPGDGQILLYTQQEPEIRSVKVPDFRGLTRQQASDLAGSLGLYILVSGNPELTPQVVSTAQSETKDTEVPVGTTIRLEFTDQKAAD